MRAETVQRRIRNSEAEIRQLHKEVERLKLQLASLKQVMMVLDRSYPPAP